MNELEVLEKEVASLRSLLQEKEAQLNALRRKWMPTQVSCDAERQNVAYEPQYTVLEPVCERNGTAPAPPRAHVGDRLPKWAIERYSRQILLPEVGVEGQERLCRARALIVGAGGLGCPAAAYLAGAGVGVIGIVDYDSVDVTNLHRQILHSEQQQGLSKVDSAVQAIRRLNSHVNVNAYHLQLTAANALEVISGYDVVLDCTDNVPTRYLLNDACVLLKVPLVSGSALKLEGQLTIYGYRPPKDTQQGDKESQSGVGPCYRCLFPTPPPPETVGSCSAQGVLGAVTGAVGALQALETVKLLVRRPQRELCVSRMLLLDGEDSTCRSVKLRSQNPECSACSADATITQLMDYEAFCRSKAKEKKKEQARLKSLRRQEEKEKRMSGRSYFGFRKTKLGETKEKWIQDVPKSERTMGPPCSSEFCAKGITRLCSVLTEEQRREIFSNFWNLMDWPAKKAFVKSLVDSTPPKRRRAKHKGVISRKGDSKVYHLMNEEERVPVCRIMFLNTLGIKEAMVRCWLMADDEKGKPKGPKKKPIKAQNVNRYLEELPKVPPKCQYCRSFTTRLYLDPSIKNLHQLYNKYVQDMTVKGVLPASRKTFTKVFVTKNLGIFKPKHENDHCDMFSQHNAAPAANVEQTFQVEIDISTQQIVPHTYITPQW